MEVDVFVAVADGDITRIEGGTGHIDGIGGLAGRHGGRGDGTEGHGGVAVTDGGGVRAEGIVGFAGRHVTDGEFGLAVADHVEGGLLVRTGIQNDVAQRALVGSILIAQGHRRGAEG